MEFESIGELAARSRLSRRTIYRAIERGELQAYKVGNRTRINVAAADAWLTATPIQRRVHDTETGVA